MSRDQGFAALIREYLRLADRSGAWLAKQIGRNPATVNRWLSGETLPNDPAIVLNMADALGVLEPNKRRELLQKASFPNYEPESPGSPPLPLPPELPKSSDALPPRLGDKFIGRERDLATLKEKLRSHSVLFIEGERGVGKTQLMVELGHQLHDAQVFDYFFYISAKDWSGQRTWLPDLLALLARGLDVEMSKKLLSLSPSSQVMQDMLHDLLKEKNSLVIIDNYDDRNDPNLETFLLRVPGPSKGIVAGWYAPKTLKDNLPFVYLHQLSGLEESDALEYSRSLAENVGEKVSEARLAWLVQALAGHPQNTKLAILAYHEINNSQDDIPPDEEEDNWKRAINKVLSDVWKRLTEQQHKLLMAATFFGEHGATASALGTTAGIEKNQAHGIIGELEGKQLLEKLRKQDGLPRYRLDSDFEEIAQQGLRENGKYAWRARLRWADYFRNYAGQCCSGPGFSIEKWRLQSPVERYFASANRVRYLPYEVEWGNFEKVLRWTKDKEQWKVLLELFELLVHYMIRRGRWQERQTWAREAAQAANHLNQTIEEILIRIDSLGWLYASIGEIRKAQVSIEDGIRLLEDKEAFMKLADTQIAGLTAMRYAFLTKSYVEAKDPPEMNTALAYMDQAHAMAEVIAKARISSADPLNLILARVNMVAGEIESSRQKYRDALSFFEKANLHSSFYNDEPGIAIVQLGFAYLKLNQDLEAAQAFDQILDYERKINHENMTLESAQAAFGKACVAHNRGDSEAARNLLLPARQFLKDRWPGLPLLKEIEQFLDKLPRRNLPYWSPLIGRERELDEITSCLQDPACRLLTLSGPGGMGKTHLTLEVVARQAERFRQGVFFVDLAPVQSVGAIPAAIARELGFTFYAGEESIQELLDYLRKKELLLLLDNFEHLLDGAGLVAAILQSAPQVKIVVTSRARLNLRDEVLFPLEGLDFPISQTRDLDQNAAVKLFLQGARRVRPSYTAPEGDWEAIGQICRGVQGMPLAILLAASWMELLSPAEIARMIDSSGLDLLEADWQDAPERQRSMRAVFDYSFKLLSPRQQQVFAGLSVFRGGFTDSAAQAVTGVSLHELRILVDKSMVQPSSSRRYHLHDLLRQYAAEALERSPELHETAQDRYCAFFAEALNGWWKDLQGSRQFISLKEMSMDLENALAAWSWMVERVQVGRMSQAFFGLMDGLNYILGLPAGSEKGLFLCQQAAEKLAPLVIPAPTVSVDGARLLVLIWSYQAGFTYRFPDLADSLLQRSEALLKQVEAAGQDIRSEKAMILWKMGALAAEAGREQDFRRLYGESLALFRELGDDLRAAHVLVDWGVWTTSMGDFDGGRRMLSESLSIHQNLGDLLGMRYPLSAMSAAAFNHGDFDEGEHQLREILSMCQESGNPRVNATGIGELGQILIRQGRFDEGCHRLAECFSILDQVGAVGDSCYYGLFLSEAEMHLGQYEQASARCQTITAYYRKNNQPEMIGFSLLLLGLAALEMGQPAEARHYLEESVAVYPENRISEQGILLALLTYAERALDQPAQAASCLVKSLSIGIKKMMVSVFNYALPAAALLLADRGEVERALQVFTLASRNSYVSHSRWFEYVVGREIEARAAGLPAEQAAAARARGQVGDLKAVADELLAEFG